MTKECNFCHQVKTLDQFRRGAKCRDCERIYEFNRREKKADYFKEYRAKNQEKFKEYEAKRRYGLHTKIYIRTCKYSGDRFITTDRSAKVKPGMEGKYAELIAKRRQEINKRSWTAYRASAPTKQCQACGNTFKIYQIKNIPYCPKCRTMEVRRHAKAKIKAAKYGTQIVEKVDRVKLFESYRWSCVICGVSTPKELLGTCEPNAPTVDHIVPFSKGGEHSYDNCQLLCFACNCSKNDAIDPPKELVIAGNILINLNNKVYESERTIKRSRTNGHSGKSATQAGIYGTHRQERQ